MRYLLFILFLLPFFSISAQIHLVSESTYEFPIQDAIFANPTDHKPVWVLVSKYDTIPHKEEELMISDMISVTSDVVDGNSDAATPVVETKPETPTSKYFILKPNGTRIDFFAGDYMLLGTSTEIVTYNSFHHSIKKYLIEKTSLKAIDSVKYSDLNETSSYLYLISGLNGKPTYLAEMKEGSSIKTRLFNEKFEEVYYFRHEKVEDNNQNISASVYGHQMRYFYTENNTYHIKIIDPTTDKIEELTGQCACQPSSFGDNAITALGDGEYIVHHDCYDSRATMLYAYTADNQLKWTKRLDNYFSNFSYIPATHTLMAEVYTVPYSAFLSLDANDGSIIYEHEAEESFKEASTAHSKAWLVFMPMQMMPLSNGKKTVCLLNCYSPSNQAINKTKLLIMDGKTEQGKVMPASDDTQYYLSALGQNRILVINGHHLSIYEIKD